jgi:hypothetical protein
MIASDGGCLAKKGKFAVQAPATGDTSTGMKAPVVELRKCEENSPRFNRNDVSPLGGGRSKVA